MFTFFVNNLNVNEILILKRLLMTAGILPYSIVQVGKEDLPDLDTVKDDIWCLVHDVTKSKSVFIKRLEEVYGKDFLDQENIKCIIPRPSTFLKEVELKEETWASLKSLRKFLRVKDVYLDKLPQKLPAPVIELLQTGGDRQSYIMETGDSKLELRNNDAEPSIENSLTYEEFAIILAARYAFNFERIHIQSSTL